MKKLFKVLLSNSYLPSWMVLFCDLTIYATTFCLTYLLSQNISDQPLNFELITLQMLTGVPFFYLAIYFLQPHRGIIRHSTTQDAAVIIFAHLIITSGLLFVALI